MGLPTRPAFLLPGAGPDADGDPERDQRSAVEWYSAVIDYLKFRAGSGWRGGRSKHRNSPRYLEYLDAIRLLDELRYQPKMRPEPVLPALAYEAAPLRTPWIKRPWDHFTRCRCAVCRSLRLRGIDPASSRPITKQERTA
jgi:hypothetical protein